MQEEGWHEEEVVQATMKVEVAGREQPSSTVLMLHLLVR